MESSEAFKRWSTTFHMVKIPFDLWIPALTKPAETFSKQKGKASLGDALISMALAGLVGGAVGGLLAGIVGLIAGAIGGLLVSGLVVPLVMNAVVWVMAKLLGGKGSYSDQFYLYSLFGAPVMLVSGVLSIVPIVGGLIGGLLSLYSLYPLTMALKQVHGFDTMKAVIAWLVPGIIVAIIAVIVGAAIIAMMAAYGLSQAAGTGY